MAYSISDHCLISRSKPVPFMPSPNSGGRLRPRFLVIHYTASGPRSDVASYFRQEAAKVSAHLVIRRDGTVTQCVPFDKIAWHAGRSQWRGKNGRRYDGLNQFSIGLELENWGALTRTRQGWTSWSGAAVDSGSVIEARHKFGAQDCGWETFPSLQMDTAIAAAKAICLGYGIEEIVGHDDIAPDRKIDPGPAWDMELFKAGVGMGTELRLA